MKLPDYDPLDERYRWCVYCKADCWPDAEYQEHADDCPTVTGKYPTKDDPGVPAGYPHDGPSRCGRCEGPLGDHYRHVLIDAGPPPVYECVCDDCALADFTEEVHA